MKRRLDSNIMKVVDNSAPHLFVVGQRVEVYWKAELEWFSGTVTEIDDDSAQCFVEYDDGDEAWEPNCTIKAFSVAGKNTDDEDACNYSDASFEEYAEEPFEDESGMGDYADDTFEGSAISIPVPKLVATPPPRISPKPARNVITSRPYHHVFRYHTATTLVAGQSYKIESGNASIGSIVTPRTYNPVSVHSFMECERIKTTAGQVQVQTQTYYEV